MADLYGITWGHRRAIEPLQAASRLWRERTGIVVEWAVRTARRV